MNPRRKPIVTASVRSFAPSFSRMLLRCTFIDFGRNLELQREHLAPTQGDYPRSGAHRTLVDGLLGQQGLRRGHRKDRLEEDPARRLVDRDLHWHRILPARHTNKNGGSRFFIAAVRYCYFAALRSKRSRFITLTQEFT